jgi:hypothetical protein
MYPPEIKIDLFRQFDVLRSIVFKIFRKDTFSWATIFPGCTKSTAFPHLEVSCGVEKYLKKPISFIFEEMGH